MSHSVPPRLAPTRVAGLLYLVPTFLGPFSMMYVPAAILAPGDPDTTARQLLASETLFRAGMVSDVAIVLSELALTAVLFALFRHVSEPLALTAAFARLAMTVVQAVNLLPELAALEALHASQPHALVQGLLELHGAGVHVWEPLFALHCLLLGLLVARSGEAPRVLGAGLVLAASGYALSGLGHLAAPSHAPLYETVVALTAIAGEVPFVIWLLARRAP
jgi:hypothetical protein